MLKLILILGLVTFSVCDHLNDEEEHRYSNFEKYCRRTMDQNECAPRKHYRDLNDKWFVCRWGSNGCAPAFAPLPHRREALRHRVFFDNDSKCQRKDERGVFMASQSFDAMSYGHHFPVSHIKSWCDFKGVAKIQVTFDDGANHAYYKNNYDLNRVPEGRTVTSVVIVPKPKKGCIILYTDADYKGSSWELCEGNFWVDPSRNYAFNSMVVGEGARVQFWNRVANAANEDAKLRRLTCLKANGDNHHCWTYRFSDFAYYDSPTNVPINTEFISICSNKYEHNRCYTEDPEYYPDIY